MPHPDGRGSSPCTESIANSRPRQQIYIPGSRYEIVHKLGFGSFSTVWLARDHDSKRYISLKMLLAGQSVETQEIRMLRTIQHDGTPNPWQRFVTRLLDTFSFHGPNGHHMCIAQEQAGRSIPDAKKDFIRKMFPVEAARSIAAQLIMGLSYIHSRKVCHGDLHIRNLLLRGQDLDDISPEDLYWQYPPNKKLVERTDGKAVAPHAPQYAVEPMQVTMPADGLFEPAVTVADFGISFVMGAEPNPYLGPPAIYAAPENLFKVPITLAADVWTMGVSLYEALGNGILFECTFQSRDYVLAEIVATLGLPPPRWWDSWENRSDFIQPVGSCVRPAKRICAPDHRSLHQRMLDMGRSENFEEGEMEALEEMLGGMLKYEPAERLTAEELLQSNYMTKWAMPAWERQLERINRVE